MGVTRDIGFGGQEQLYTIEGEEDNIEEFEFRLREVLRNGFKNWSNP